MEPLVDHLVQDSAVDDIMFKVTFLGHLFNIKLFFLGHGFAPFDLASLDSVAAEETSAEPLSSLEPKFEGQVRLSHYFDIVEHAQFVLYLEYSDVEALLSV